MVFGNIGDDCATGVFMSRNATTGEPVLEGDYLINAQGEDVVAGTRATLPIGQLADDMPERYAELEQIAHRSSPGKTSPEYAGHGVYHRAGQALDVADP